MRIRLKKGVALFGTIAGAAVATALIVYNVNRDNTVNTSDVADSGLLDDLENALEGKPTETTPAPTAVADAKGQDAAAAAGLLGSDFAEDAKADTTPAEPVHDEAQKPESEAKEENEEGESGDMPFVSVTAQPEALEEAEPVQEVREEVLTYVEAVPETHTETRVRENTVVVEVPVTVTELVTEQVEADPVDFRAQSDAATVQEMTSTRRADEARAAYEADQERLRAAAEAQSGQDVMEKTGDDVSGESFIVFY